MLKPVGWPLNGNQMCRLHQAEKRSLHGEAQVPMPVDALMFHHSSWNFCFEIGKSRRGTQCSKPMGKATCKIPTSSLSHAFFLQANHSRTPEAESDIEDFYGRRSKLLLLLSQPRLALALTLSILTERQLQAPPKKLNPRRPSRMSRPSRILEFPDTRRTQNRFVRLPHRQN